MGVVVLSSLIVIIITIRFPSYFVINSFVFLHLV